MSTTDRDGRDEDNRNDRIPSRNTTTQSRLPKLIVALAVAMVVGGVALVIDNPFEQQGVTIYSSFPLQGPQRGRSLDVIDAMKLALKQEHGRAGDIDVTFMPLDDSSAEQRGWTQGRVFANAQRAAEDDSTAVYIGEFNSGASTVSIPILSQAKIAQISPSNTADVLTTSEQFYSDGFRNFARIVPRDAMQARALAGLMKKDGCTRIAMVHDTDLYGAGLARGLRRAVHERGLRFALDEFVDSRASSVQRALARRSARQGADCFVFSGDTASGAVGIFTQMAASLGPDAGLYGPDGIVERAFTDPRSGGISSGFADRVQMTMPVLGRSGYTDAGEQFFEDFEQEYPANTNPDPYAILGYEVMRLALDVIRLSKSGDSEDVVEALRDITDRQSVLGTYSLSPHGDTDLRRYGLFTIQDGAPFFQRAIRLGG